MKSSGLVLFACAGLLLSGGAILGGSTLWSLLRLSFHFWTSDLGVEIGSGVLVVAASFLCLPICWLCTIVPYHPRVTPLQTTLMYLSTATMLLLSIGIATLTGLSRAIREPATLNASMLRAMAYEAVDPLVRSSFADMQLELKCCGVQSYNDWYNHRSTLPPACCNRLLTGKIGEHCEVPTFTNGCLKPALIELRAYVNSISILSSATMIVLAVTLFSAAYMLVTNLLEREEARVLKPNAHQPLRIACVAHQVPPILSSFTSPAAMPVSPHHL